MAELTKVRHGPTKLVDTGGTTTKNDLLLSADMGRCKRIVGRLTVLQAAGTNPTLDLEVVDAPENDYLFFSDTTDGAFDQMTGPGTKTVMVEEFTQFINFQYSIGGTDSPEFTIILDLVGKE